MYTYIRICVSQYHTDFHVVYLLVMWTFPNLYPSWTHVVYHSIVYVHIFCHLLLPFYIRKKLIKTSNTTKAWKCLDLSQHSFSGLCNIDTSPFFLVISYNSVENNVDHFPQKGLFKKLFKCPRCSSESVDKLLKCSLKWKFEKIGWKNSTKISNKSYFRHFFLL